MSVLTPDALRDSTRASGYKYVSNAQSRGGKNPLWCAKKGRFAKGSAAQDWHGPCRRDPRQAAQDYCDYINGNGATPASPLRSAGHTGRRASLPADPEVLAALGVLRDARGQRKGNQGYVYLIVEEREGGGMRHGKIGYSTNPEARVAELQTGNPRKLRLHLSKPGTLEDEAALHAKYASQNILQEWFRLTAELLLEWDASHIVRKAA